MVQHPVEACNAQYLIISTVLRMTGQASTSGDILSGVSRCEFVAIRGTAPFRLPRTTPKPLIIGAQTAIVVTRPGYEVDADSYGRVRVRFHWDRRKRGEVKFAENSCPVRVSQLWAGSGFGGIHIPRKDQEVIVEFLEGDPDRPIITGRVYNALNAVPYKLPTHLTQSGIKTSTIGQIASYNELRFEDEKGKEEIFIQAERNKTVKVKRTRSTTVGASDSLSVGANRTVTTKGNLLVHVGDKTGKYALDAVESIELQCGTSTIKLTPEGIEIKGAKIAIEGTALIDENAPIIKLNS